MAPVDEHGTTPAHCAAENGHSKALVFLASKDCDMAPVDDVGETPAHHAAHNGHSKALEFLTAMERHVEEEEGCPSDDYGSDDDEEVERCRCTDCLALDIDLGPTTP
jgi:hypothetical protein